AEAFRIPLLELAHRGAHRELGFKVADIVTRARDLLVDLCKLAARRRHLERYGVEHHREDQNEKHQADSLELASRHQHEIASFVVLPPDQAGAAVRTALRNVADRARGLRASSALPGRTLRAGGWKVAARAGGASAGRWREARTSPPLRSRRKDLTIRSSVPWKLTTARRPPGRSSRSGAASPALSSSSSALMWMRIA